MVAENFINPSRQPAMPLPLSSSWATQVVRRMFSASALVMVHQKVSGRHLPRDAGDENEEDGGKGLAVTNRPASGKAKPPGFRGRQVQFDYKAHS